MVCESFRPELFTEPREYEETPLRDRKREFPNLYHDERKIEVARRCYSSSRGLQWVLNLGILHLLTTGVSFSHPYLQYYFGAEYLRDDANLRNKWKKKCTPDFWRSVMTFLNQIQYQEVPYDATG